jgi:uncharacterized membrane protein YjjP (DUF1212 family)
MNQAIRNVSFVVFWIGAALAVALALVPHNVAPPFPYDKLQHVAGFTVLTICGLVWVTKKLPFIVALALAGGLLELVQGLPVIGREAALLDWLASLLGIAMGLTLYGASGRVMDTRVKTSDPI